MDLKLDGRAYYVTGGSRGIGKAIVQCLLSEGARVATCGRDENRLSAAWRDVGEGARDRLLLRQADVLDERAMAARLDEAASHFGRLDGVVANAGAGVGGGVLDTPASAWRDQFELKVQSVLNLVIPAVGFLAASDSGRIVIVNGITARVPDAAMAAVSAARAAVFNLARSLATELAGASICTNVVNPGPISTNRQRERHARTGSDIPFEEWSREEARRRGVPIGRMGQPDEVAAVVVFLLSPLASYVSGASIDVAGGMNGHV